MCSLQQLLLLLSFSYLGTAQTLCGAAGFNVDPLIKPDYYKIDIPEKFCSEFFQHGCTLFVSFCNKLPENLNLCNNNDLPTSSVCITDGTTGYSLGEYSDNPFEPIEDKLIASFHNGSDELCEKDNLNTFIDFQCGPEAMWSAVQGQNHGDASAYFDGLIIDFENLCSVTITVRYDQICPLAVCEAKGHDISELLGPPYWKADVHHLQCKDFFGKEEPCTLYLSFCQDITGVPECAGSTVCLTDGTTTYTFGQYNNYTNPFATSARNSLEVLFDRGKNYSKCPHNPTSTVLVMDCAHGQDWDDPGNASAHLLTIGPVLENACSVSITMDYSGACALPESNSSSSTGVGWVGLGLIIALLVIVTLYLTIGSAVNIANGKNNCPEMLPQFAFWKAFFIYVIEGFYFTADLITCGWCSRTAGPAPSSNYDKL